MTSYSLRLAAVASFLGLVGLVSACSSDDSSSSSSSSSGGGAGPTSAEVVKQYAALVHESYEDSLGKMKLFQTTINTFVATPSQANLDAAKAAWVAARNPYSETEAFRFYNGPIDNEETGPEGMINGWPIDENFVDYVVGKPESGIINLKTADAFTFPTIDAKLIETENEQGGEKNLSAGWHVIEFLLWGQDLRADGTPNNDGTGVRPFTDFVDNGTASNQSRRRDYLKAATDLMVEQFEAVEKQWDLEGDTYATKLIAGDANVALGNILKGIGSLAGTELPKERMNNAYETKEQEEEHSCFSDTTLNDLFHNGKGIENVYTGTYGTFSGPASISAMVAAKDAALDTKTKADIAAALSATQAIPAPFDTAILGDDADPGRVAVKKAIDSWAVVTQDIVAVSTALGVTINLSDE